MLTHGGCFGKHFLTNAGNGLVIIDANTGLVMGVEKYRLRDQNENGLLRWILFGDTFY